MSDMLQIENRPFGAVSPRVATMLGALLAAVVIFATVAFITVAGAQSAQPINRSGQQVTGENYTGANLSGANFSNATISGSSFIGANLSNANFSGATITSSGGISTTFGGANLSNTNFTGAKFTAANIQYSTLSCTNFSNSDMSGVIAGAALTGLSTTCAPVFTGATVNCGIAQFSGQLNLSGATVPTGCQTPKALANAAAAGAPAWQCAGVAPSGYSSWTYANVAGGSDSNACTASAPCASVKAALAACPTGQSCGALIYFGQYMASQTVTLAANQGVIGACLATSGSGDESNYYSTLGLQSGVTGMPVLSATGAAHAAISNFQFTGSNASSAASAVAVTVHLSSSSSLALQNVTVIGATGGVGVKGSDNTTTPSNGGGASGQTGASSSCAVAGGNGGNGQSGYSARSKVDCYGYACTNNSCNGVTGAYGSMGYSASYSNGGSVGGVACQNSPFFNCDAGTGKSGQAGQSGQCGAGGSAQAVLTGTYGPTGWMPLPGGP